MSDETKNETTASSRRSVLAGIGAGWTLFTAATVAGTGMTVRFLFPNDTFEPPSRFKCGFPAEFGLGVSIKYKERAVWIVRNKLGFYALSTVCTHLGCTPNWLGAEEKFKCPCHGSGFYSTGINFEGPAPRPLERHKIGLAPDGQIEIDKSKKYQQEKGQWDDPDSFLNLAFSA
jgi:cytochrome b6-f complex iron-sulfur subunit